MSRLRLNLVGQKFTRLTVISFSHSDKKSRTYWNCICDCGNTKIVCGGNLKSGSVKSCKCLHKEIITMHGMCTASIYIIWKGIIQRCHNPNTKKYYRYGGRGIKVCKRWKNSFINFYKDMGDRPKGKSIDRINNNGNYSPKNCKWSTQKEQCSNTSNNVLVTIDKKTKTVSEWSRIKKINNSTVFKRINRSGWLPEKAILTPV